MTKTTLDLLREISALQTAGHALLDAELIDPVAELVTRVETLVALLETGEQLAHAMGTVVLQFGAKMSPADLRSREANADRYLALIEES